MKVGISVKIDVTKIDKSRLFKGEKGTYLDLTTFVDLDNKDQYENNGFIAHSQTKMERESKTNTPIVGNVRVFYTDSQLPAKEQPQATNQPRQEDGFDDDIPF